MATSPTIAIVTRDIGKDTETFVRRHVEHLFDGRVVVLNLRTNSGATVACPNISLPYLQKRGEIRSNSINRTLQTVKLRHTMGRALNFLEKHKVTHVLCEFGYVATEIADDLMDAGYPVFCYFRGRDASQYLTRNRYRQHLARIFPRLSGVIAVSHFLLDQLADKGLSHQNSIVIPSGTDTRQVKPGKKEDCLILTVGRLIEKKDPMTALEAFAIATRHLSVTWKIVGRGPFEEPMLARSKELGVYDKIQFLGPQPHDEVVALMERAAVYLQAFRTGTDGDTEGMPSALQEAMAAGCAVVTTRHAGVPEHIFEGRTGLLCDPGDVAALGESLEKVLVSTELAKRLGDAAREHAEKALDYRALFSRLERFMLTASPVMANGPRYKGPLLRGRRPEVVLHLGAHRTGTTSLQSVLDSEADELAGDGTVVLLPPRPGHREAYTIRDWLMQTRKAQKSWKAAGLGKRARKVSRAKVSRAMNSLILANSCEGEPRRVILSEEMLLGPAFAQDGTAVYPHAAKIMRSVLRYLPGPVRTLHLTVRNYESFLVSVYAMRAIYVGGLPDFDSLRPQLLQLARGWPDLVADIVDIFPNTPLVVTRFETSSVPERAALVAGRPALRRTELNEMKSNVAPTSEAIEAALRLGERPEDPDALVALHAAGTRFDPLGPEEKTRLRLRYEADLEKLGQIGPNVLLV